MNSFLLVYCIYLLSAKISASEGSADTIAIGAGAAAGVALVVTIVIVVAVMCWRRRYIKH